MVFWGSIFLVGVLPISIKIRHNFAFMQVLQLHKTPTSKKFQKNTGHYLVDVLRLQPIRICTPSYNRGIMAVLTTTLPTRSKTVRWIRHLSYMYIVQRVLVLITILFRSTRHMMRAAVF
nr:MAG TPA: hypothetical protein [Caudoviricetes sp.]